MSSRTQRWRDRLPSFLLPKDPEPVLVDGLLELECAYQMYEILARLPDDESRARALWHVEAIATENAKRRHDFFTSEQRLVTTRPAEADDSRAA